MNNKDDGYDISDNKDADDNDANDNDKVDNENDGSDVSNGI